MQKTTTTLVDDLDGTEALSTVSFSIDGANYEIDLNVRHIAEFRSDIEPYIKYARKVRQEKVALRSAASRRRSKAIREWIKEMYPNAQVPPRGRIPTHFTKQYDAHH
jgi:hypothetical protein